MLRITVEVVPHGIESAAHKLGIMTVGNIETNRRTERAKYRIVFTTNEGKIEREVGNYYRKSGWLPLVRECFDRIMA